MKPCVIVLSYPNTENKLNILSKCLESVKKLDYPIFLFSNMDIDLGLLPEIDDFITTGENIMYSASDFLPIEQITYARNITKYRYHLMFGDGLINYLPISYGTEKNYYWALTKLYQKAFNHINNLGFTHFMLLQELNLGDEELKLVNQYFSEANDLNLDGIFAVEPEMGPNHLSDFVFFGRSSWWSELFNTMTVNEFYETTIPNWTIEEYYLKKCKLKGGKIKFKVRTNLEECHKKYYDNVPVTWIRDDINCNSRETFNLFFPELSQNNLSNNTETPSFDVEKTFIVSITKHDSGYQIFLWNQNLSIHDRDVDINLTFSKNNDIDIDAQPIELKLPPGVWNVRYYDEYIKGSQVDVTYTYEDEGEIKTLQRKYYI